MNIQLLCAIVGIEWKNTQQEYINIRIYIVQIKIYKGKYVL